MFAVIKTGGKQYKVEAGTEIAVELLKTAPGEKVKIDDVLLVADGNTISVGHPLVAGVSVDAEVLEQIRGPKTIAFKKLRRKGKQWKKGHRQELTRLRITGILANDAAVE